MNENQQELIFKLSMFEQQIQHLQQQLQAVEQGIVELDSLSLGLSDVTSSRGKDIFAPVGRGIFVKAKMQSEDLIVDVGGRNFVKKSVPETQKMINEQVQKLENVKKELNNHLERLSDELTKTMIDAQGKEQESN